MSEGMVQGSLVSATMVSPIVAQIEYPVLKKLGKQNIRKFLTERRSYVREIEERNAQGNGTVGRPVSLNFSVDPSILESLVELGQLGPAVKSVSEVTDAVLSTWLEKHSDLKKDGLSASQVQAIVDRSLRINMSEKDTEQRIIMLFADYRGILRNHGLAWIVDENPKTAVNHIVDALKPSILKKRIKDDLTFGHIALRKIFLDLCVTSSEEPSTTRTMRSRQIPLTNSGNQTLSPAQTPGLRSRVQGLVAYQELQQPTLQTRSQASPLERVGPEAHLLV